MSRDNKDNKREIRRLLEMDLHDCIELNGGHTDVMRVPGGWWYMSTAVGGAVSLFVSEGEMLSLDRRSKRGDSMPGQSNEDENLNEIINTRF